MREARADRRRPEVAMTTKLSEVQQRAAATFGSSDDAIYRMVARILAERGIDEADVLLDIGCGIGACAPLLRRIAGRITASMSCGTTHSRQTARSPRPTSMHRAGPYRMQPLTSRSPSRQSNTS